VCITNYTFVREVNYSFLEELAAWIAKSLEPPHRV